MEITLWHYQSKYIYHQISCNTCRYKNSFFPDSIKAWNSLGAAVHSCTSLSNFKNEVCVLIRPNLKLTFNIHDRQGLKYIFQLRVGLSLLRSNKKDISLLIPPLIGANVILLLKIPITFSYTNLFQVSRTELINSITPVVSPYNFIDEINNQELFLHGHRNISSEDNMKIILSTIKYLTETGRFAKNLLSCRTPFPFPAPSPSLLSPHPLPFSCPTLFPSLAPSPSLLLPHPLPFSRPTPSLFLQDTSTFTFNLSFIFFPFYMFYVCTVLILVCVVSVDVDNYIVMSTLVVNF